MMKPPSAAAQPLRAVLADDERLPREQLRAALARVWPELQLVGEASHGAEALSLIERLQPDVAFLDIRMPEMSGLEVAHAVRALPLPCAVVFLTAFDEHALAAFDAQAVDYLLKPVDEQRLAQTAQRLRERHAQLMVFLGDADVPMDTNRSQASSARSIRSISSGISPNQTMCGRMTPSG